MKTGLAAYWPALVVALPVGISSGYLTHRNNIAERERTRQAVSNLSLSRELIRLEEERRAGEVARLRQEVRSLASKGDGDSIRALIAHLQHERWEVRVEAAEALVQVVGDAERARICADPSNVDRIVAGLRAPQPAARAALCRVLGVLRVDRTKAELERVARSDTSEAVRKSAREALAGFP